MTMISIHAGAPRRQPPSLSRALLDLLAEAARRRRKRMEMTELSRLPHHLLRDMGLERYAALDVRTISNHWR